MRGTGLSRPRLDCPEVDADRGEGRGGASARPVVRGAFLDAVAACRRHLTDQGIDVAAYDVSEAAADIIDARVALGIDEWGFDSKGDVAARGPPTGWDRILHLVLDTPSSPAQGRTSPAWASTKPSEGSPPLVPRTRRVPKWRRMLPKLLRRAVDRLDADAVVDRRGVGAIARREGRPISLRIDGGKLLRAVGSRWAATVRRTARGSRDDAPPLRSR